MIASLRRKYWKTKFALNNAKVYQFTGNYSNQNLIIFGFSLWSRVCRLIPAGTLRSSASYSCQSKVISTFRFLVFVSSCRFSTGPAPSSISRVYFNPAISRVHARTRNTSARVKPVRCETTFSGLAFLVHLWPLWCLLPKSRKKFQTHWQDRSRGCLA